MARISLRSNRKFMKLVRDIQRPPYQARGLLEMMWESAHENSPIFPTLDDAEVVSTWDGEVGVFGKAVLDAGFLDEVDGGYFVHDYWQHAPGWVREREKKRQQRDTKGRDGDNKGTQGGQSGDTSSRGAPSVAKRSVGKEREDQEPPLVGVGECSLASLPKIASAYTKIRDCILENHPKAILPEIGTEKELNDRKELERLIRLDGYTESDVIKTLKWVLREEPPGDFTWRAQFRSLSALRTVKDGATKFTKMYEAMNRHKAPPPEKCPFSKDDELYPEWMRQKALGLV